MGQSSRISEGLPLSDASLGPAAPAWLVRTKNNGSQRTIELSGPPQHGSTATFQASDSTKLVHVSRIMSFLECLRFFIGSEIRFCGVDEHRCYVRPSARTSCVPSLQTVKRPSVVVDLGNIPSLREIQASGAGLEIGAMTPLSEVVRHAAVQEQYQLLADAAAVVASFARWT